MVKKKNFLRIFTVSICLLFLASCAQNAELPGALELTDEMIDISALGMTDEDFRDMYADNLDSVAPEITVVDSSSLKSYRQTFIDDEEYFIRKSYRLDDASKISLIGLSCEVHLPDKDYQEDEYKEVYKKSVENCLNLFKETFLPDAEPSGRTADDATLLSWTTGEYNCQFASGYAATRDDSEDICIISMSIFLN